jgi:nitroimidazol reductase NimA-like FMN-containing flavoprotein (pyridoxamine 5'-phosphate oxidase superfamily)
MTESAATRPPLSPTPRSTVTRMRERAVTDRAALDAILDAALVCHLGVLLDGAPVVLPTMYGRDGDTLYLHGSTGAGNLRAALAAPVSVAVTLLDGIVYARAAMHFSMNYRSAVMHGRLAEVTDPDARLHGLRTVLEHATPGAWEAVRQPSRKELAATMVLSLDLTEASVKTRSGDPRDDAADLTADTWAGVLPIRQVFDPPIPSADLAAPIAIPEHIRVRVDTSPVPGY